MLHIDAICKSRGRKKRKEKKRKIKAPQASNYINLRVKMGPNMISGLNNNKAKAIIKQAITNSFGMG